MDSWTDVEKAVAKFTKEKEFKCFETAKGTTESLYGELLYLQIWEHVKCTIVHRCSVRKHGQTA